MHDHIPLLSGEGLAEDRKHANHVKAVRPAAFVDDCHVGRIAEPRRAHRIQPGERGCLRPARNGRHGVVRAADLRSKGRPIHPEFGLGFIVVRVMPIEVDLPFPEEAPAPRPPPARPCTACPRGPIPCRGHGLTEDALRCPLCRRAEHPLIWPDGLLLEKPPGPPPATEHSPVKHTDRDVVGRDVVALQRLSGLGDVHLLGEVLLAGPEHGSVVFGLNGGRDLRLQGLPGLVEIGNAALQLRRHNCCT
mmetsp:Transcript_320/g.734  ORF Transcript_320/g.734 Transcript_320/m.734 type:complete len:248 (-) Transcript_320:657-1400(-)